MTLTSSRCSRAHTSVPQPSFLDAHLRAEARALSELSLTATGVGARGGGVGRGSKETESGLSKKAQSKSEKENEGAGWEINGPCEPQQDLTLTLKPEKGNLDRWRDTVAGEERTSFIFEPRCSIAWPVHLIGAVRTGLGSCRMAAGSCQPPGSSEGNMIQ